MRKINNTLKIMMVITAIALSWQTYAAGAVVPGDVINVDFGDYEIPASGWNTIAGTAGSIADAITANGDLTGVSVTMPDHFGADSFKGTDQPDPLWGFLSRRPPTTFGAITTIPRPRSCFPTWTPRRSIN